MSEDELKLMLRGAELSGAIEEEEQVKFGAVVKVFRPCHELSNTGCYIKMGFDGKSYQVCI